MDYKMKQKGFILVVSLVFLVIMTLLALSMFSGFTVDETISGNQREKSRATDAAQTALNNAEYFISASSVVATLLQTQTSGVACAGTYTAPVVCSNALTNPTNPAAWTSYMTVSAVPATMVSTTGGVNTYSQQPQVYIQYLMPGPIPNSGLFQVTAAAQGGNSTAISVVQAVYLASPLNPSLNGNNGYGAN
jgi:type IV pilus assembly protein PilX